MNENQANQTLLLRTVCTDELNSCLGVSEPQLLVENILLPLLFCVTNWKICIQSFVWSSYTAFLPTFSRMIYFVFMFKQKYNPAFLIFLPNDFYIYQSYLLESLVLFIQCFHFSLSTVIHLSRFSSIHISLTLLHIGTLILNSTHFTFLNPETKQY